MTKLSKQQLEDLENMLLEEMEAEDAANGAADEAAVEAASTVEIETETVAEIETEFEGEVEKAVVAPIAPKKAAKVIEQDDDDEDMALYEKNISFNENTLNDAVMSQAALYAYFGRVAANKAYTYELKKAAFAKLESEIDNHLRQETVARGDKVVETKLSKEVLLDPRHLKGMKAVLEAKRDSVSAQNRLEALKQRKDMLVQVAVDLREERKGEMRIKSVSNGFQSKIDNARAIVGAA